MVLPSAYWLKNRQIFKIIPHYSLDSNIRLQLTICTYIILFLIAVSCKIKNKNINLPTMVYHYTTLIRVYLILIAMYSDSKSKW